MKLLEELEDYYPSIRIVIFSDGSGYFTEDTRCVALMTFNNTEDMFIEGYNLKQ